MWGVPVFPEKNALPCSQAEAAVVKRDDLCCAGEGHFDMTRHVVRAFEGVGVVGVMLGDELVHEVVQIDAGARIGILHDDQTATGVLAKNGHGACPEACFAERSLDLPRELVGALSVGADGQSVGENSHEGG